MAKKKFLLGMLVVALVFTMTVVGCEEEESPPKYVPVYVLPEPDNYVTITFDANGGKWDDGSTTKSVKVPYDTTNIKIYVREPTWQGKTFYRWTSYANPDPDTLYHSGSYRHDSTVYADWR